MKNKKSIIYIKRFNNKHSKGLFILTSKYLHLILAALDLFLIFASPCKWLWALFLFWELYDFATSKKKYKRVFFFRLGKAIKLNLSKAA